MNMADADGQHEQLRTPQYSRQRVSGVPSAASVIETIMAATSPSRSTSSAKAIVASVIMMTGRQAQPVRPGLSATTA